ncbi:MAG: 1-(5-phosphoribosyl)-5-[(5-phosphoribosylamino)methylideneamino]imidazole-4-carboxamide isomerase [Candidatus Hadarchaeales archaeon]
MIPSIDIRKGKCVQMVKGVAGTEKIYGDPVEQALRWQREGAKLLHVVDLDAAMGEGDNLDKIIEILANTSIPVQVGGGIRSFERASELAANGASRVIVGTAAVENQELVKRLVESLGRERVVCAVDIRDGKVAVEGWKRKTEVNPLSFAKRLEELGVGSLLVTSVDVEGSMGGIRKNEIEKIIEGVSIPVIAAGGIGSLDDIREVMRIGAWGVVVGMALYEGRFSLVEAMEVAE